MPVSALETFYLEATQVVHEIDELFGLRDSNRNHFTLIEREGGDPEWAKNDLFQIKILYQVLADVQGSISAEHGTDEGKVDQLWKL